MSLARHLKGSLAILLALGLGDLLTALHISLLGITDIIWVVLVVPILGSLVLSLFLVAEKFKFQEWIIYCVGVGLATLMAAGLAVNTVGLSINRPVLTSAVIIPMINCIIAGLLIARIRLFLHGSPRRLFPKLFSREALIHKVRVLAPLCLPLLAILGAIRLNNGAGNSLALLALVLICAYPLALIILIKKVYREEILVSLFAIGVALALSVSMRSNYLIGFDIHQEFEVFSAAANTGLWHPHLFNNAYNACLSITILPAVLKALMPISSEYLFKFIMQLLFGIMPIIVFVIADSKLKKKRYAYIAALLFVVQGPFIFEFPGLIRQQIGLIFFGLIFASAMSTTLSRFTKSALLIVFGIAMITSHYSTTYVTIALLLILVILKPLLSWLRNRLKNYRHASRQSYHNAWHISPVVVLIILLGAFLWYGETLQATGGITQKLENSITSFNSILNSNSHSSFITDTLGLGNYTYSSATLQQISKNNSVSGGYQPSPSQYQPQPAEPHAPTIDNGFQDILLIIEHKFIPLFAGAMIGIGLIIMLVGALLNRRSLDDGLLAIGSGCLFLLLTLLPNISQDYNLERLYQQLLVLISPAFIYGFTLLFRRWFSPRILTSAMLCIVVVYLVGTSGLIDQFAFGISNINLVNDGVNYDHYYTNLGEVRSLSWLQNTPGLVKVNLDRYSILNAEAYTTIPSSKLRGGVFPTEVRSGSYVYASTINLNGGLAFDLYQNNVITFNFPTQYFNNNKDTVYANQESVVYK